jgi:hypothetical protein
MLGFLDIVLTIAHLLLIGFNLLGWVWVKTRKVHLITVLFTAGSWLILGLWYGLGYCPITDWQWKVKEKLGESNLPNSFIKYYADKLTGSDVDAAFIDTVTAISFAVVALLSLFLNLKELIQLLVPGKMKR